MVDSIEEIVGQYYAEKDEMHNINHIHRLLKKARILWKKYGGDWDLIQLSAYLHGLPAHAQEEVVRKLKMPKKKQLEAIRIARESIKDASPKTLEGRILHDAHLLENNELWFFIKSLWTGAKRGQSLEQTLTYMKQHLLFQHKCCFDEENKEYVLRNLIADCLAALTKMDVPEPTTDKLSWKVDHLKPNEVDGVDLGDGEQILGIKENGRLAAYVCGKIVRSNQYRITRLDVCCPNGQRVSLQKALVFEAINFAKQQGVSEVSVFVDVKQEDELSLYRSLGFRVAGFLIDNGKEIVFLVRYL